VTGESVSEGRAVYDIAATAQEFRPHWPGSRLAEQVIATVDAELGILLRCEQLREGRVLELEQFQRLRVFAPAGAGANSGPAPDAAAFSLPPGMLVPRDRPSTRFARMAGRAIGAALARAAEQTRRP
jgi:hypothetical protein